MEHIISVGYRVKSHRGTQFRIWATQRLREYIIKGFALDDERFIGRWHGEVNGLEFRSERAQQNAEPSRADALQGFRLGK